MNGPIAWFARNGVVGNLLLVVIVASGAITLTQLNSTLLPDVTLELVTVTVPYRGAAPSEVEQSVCVLVEEELQGVRGIEKITATASEGLAYVVAEIESGHSLQEVRDDIKSSVEGIETFPEGAGKPVVRLMPLQVEVISIAIAGSTEPSTLKMLGERARDQLLDLPEISQVELVNVRPYEIAIEVSEEAMRRWGLTFDSVASAIRNSSVDLPGGSVKTESGDVRLRTTGRAYTEEEFEGLPLVRRLDGTQIRLGDVAMVIDGFEDVTSEAKFDGRPAVVLNVYRVGDENALAIADAVYAYVDRASATLPDGVQIDTWQDWGHTLRSRQQLLVENALAGLLLVFIVLALFMRLRLAIWVAIGIPVSFLGAMALMPVFDVTINMISLLGFIVVLGIVVDDAIVVAENVQKKQSELQDGLAGAIEGTREVCVPVVFGVMTTMVAFCPMFFVSGAQGKLLQAIPLVVLPTLLFSLIESSFILPGHLANQPQPQPGRRVFGLVRAWDRICDQLSKLLDSILNSVYLPTLHSALRWRYLTLAMALTVSLVTLGLVGGGYIPQILVAADEADNVVAFVTMPQDATVDVTREAVAQVERAALELRAEIADEQGSDQFRHVLTSIGEQPFKLIQGGPAARINPPKGDYLGEINIELQRAESRSISAEEIARRLRDKTGDIPSATEFTVTYALLGGGKAIQIQFSGSDLDQVREVASRAKARLSQYPGVHGVTDTSQGGVPEVQLALASEGEALGLTLEHLGRQVRQGFFGEEVQRIQRGREDVRVMLRYPESQRRSLADVEQMRIRTADGSEVSFSTVAEASIGRGPTEITRVDRYRSITVLAAVDNTVTTGQEVLADLEANDLAAWSDAYPSVRYAFLGDEAEMVEALEALSVALAVALFIMFATLAIPLKSYVEPVIVLSAVPFGAVGAVWGHAIMGIPLSFNSIYGMVALAGVVVNDSLVLVSFVHDHAHRAASRFEAVCLAGKSRFRAIILTTLTTTAGLSPLLLETDLQAQFLIPLTVSLAFGVLFATLVTLLLVPAIYLILDDFRRAVGWLLGGTGGTARRNELDVRAGGASS